MFSRQTDYCCRGWEKRQLETVERIEKDRRLHLHLVSLRAYEGIAAGRLDYPCSLNITGLLVATQQTPFT